MPKVDLSNYEGREQAYVKHFLLENYLSKWSYIIGSSWDSLVFIDGFAGPWGAKDEKFADASFSIAVRAPNEAIAGLLKSRKRVVRGLCVFVEKKPDAFKKLDAFARARSTDQVGAVALKGRFIQNIPVIDNHVAEVGVNPFKFVFLDQKGWAATPNCIYDSSTLLALGKGLSKCCQGDLTSSCLMRISMVKQWRLPS